MAKHKYFEELCALAPLGELSPPQFGELAGHLHECEECRHAAADYDRIYWQIVPAVNRLEDEFIARRHSDIRDSVLRGVAAEPHPATVRAKVLRPSFALPVLLKLGFALRAGLAASVLAVTAFWIGAHSFTGSTGQRLSQVTSARPMKPNLTATNLPAQPAEDLESKHENEWLAALEAERNHSTQLARKVSVEEKELQQAIAVQDTLRAKLESQAKTLEGTQSQLTEKEAQFAQMQAQNSSSTATLAALQYQVRDLTNKLDAETANLDRESGLLLHGHEIRDIIGARNLHIIDVYDTDTDGGTGRPFARAFYTEHKSLVYYAYDLPQRRIAEGKYSYVAWGQSNGNKNSIQKIGILFNDDQNQRRWSLHFTDPTVLADIDSVFITLERTDKDAEQPKGRRMLTAYLGAAANHL